MNVPPQKSFKSCEYLKFDHGKKDHFVILRHIYIFVNEQRNIKTNSKFNVIFQTKYIHCLDTEHFIQEFIF